MSNSRTKNSKRNIFSGVIRQVLNIGLAFASRTIVLYLMGEQYLGLGSLFSSILSILNLADLGFSTAVVYILYKPIAENDRDAICAIVAYLKKVYNVIGGVILLAGLAVMPFLPSLIAGDYPSEINIYVLYLMYLAHTVLSYWFFAYKSALFTAMQRSDIVNNIYSVASFWMKVIQLVLLVTLRNYYLFTLILPLGSVFNNLMLQYFSRRLFPDIIPKGTIPPKVRKNLSKQVQALFIGKVGDVARNSCDSLFLSVLLGLSALAIYDNYLYIYSSIIGVLWMIIHAIQASVGDSMATETVEKNAQDFFRFDFLFAWISGWCTVCLCCLFQPFMYIWMDGDRDMMLSTFNMLLICLYFYSVAINNVRNLYINGAGLFWEIKTWYILEAIGNVLLNLILGYFFGISGIIGATIICVLTCNFVARSNVLFRSYFKTTATAFYGRHCMYFVVTAAACGVTWFCCSFVADDGILGLMLRALICILVPNALFFCAYFKTKVFRESVSLAIRILKAR